MNKKDEAQLDAIYSFMKNKNKKLNTFKQCKICKGKKHKEEFNTHTLVCKNCWNYYIKMTKEEKRKLGK